MRTHLVLLTVVVASLPLGGVAQSGTGELQLEAARKKAVIDGDLDIAVRDFGLIADRYRTIDPPVAAAALLLLAEAHESVGDARSAGAYARLVSEHPGRGEARTARVRLAQASNQGARILRPIWEGQGVDWSGRVSADGRYLAFVDRLDLVVRDLTTGSDTRLTNQGSDETEFGQGNPVISRDGTKVAYTWHVDRGNQSQLRVIDRRDGAAAPRVFNLGPDVAYAQPVDWAPDGDRIVVKVQRKDRTAQIGLVTVAGGAYRSLKSVDWRGPTNLEVSPDGEHLAYDLPVSDTSRDRDVFVLRLDGTRMEQRANDRPGLHTVVGWAPGGDMVLYATERAGTIVLHGTALTNGIPQGAPRVVEPDLGTFHGSRGITDSGRLVFTKKTGAINVFTTAIDFEAGSTIATPDRVTDSVVSNFNSVMWSPDGQYLAYVMRHRGTPSFVIRSAGTGAAREITPAIRQIQSPRWSAPSFIVFQGSDLRGRQGIFRTDIQTGETTLIVGGDEAGYRSWPDATPDGRHVIFGLNDSAKFNTLVRDLETGAERTLVAGGGTSHRVSPNGQWVAYRTGDAGTSSIMVVPIAGGEPRSVVTVPTSQGLEHFVDWMPDSRHLLAIVGRKLSVVALDAGSRREIALPDESIGPSLELHPDGRRVAYSAGPTREGYELWTLENFLPAAARR